MLVEAVFNTGLHSVGAIFALLFTAVRILVWAFLVATAWYEIVEKPFEQEVKERAKNWKTTDPGPVELTETALDQHQAAEAVYKQENKNKTTGQQVPPARQRPGNIIPRSSGRSGMADGDDDESVDRWSIGENERELGGRGAPHFQPHTPPPAHHTPSEGLVAEPIPSVPETRYTGVNTNVVRPAVQVVALDEPTGGKKGSGSRGSAGKKHFINRKVEEYLVEPYEKQYEQLGYFLYRGISKSGIRLETSLNTLTKQLDGAIRDAGVEAVNRVEVVMRRYLKFIGAVVVLTVVLLPLPSVHISLGVA